MTTIKIHIPERTIIAAAMILTFLPVCALRAEKSALFERANDILFSEQYAEALSAYKLFIEKYPKHRLMPAAMWTVANIYMNVYNEYDKAAAYYVAIIDKNINTEWTMSAYDRLGRCFEEQQQWQNASDVYKPAILALSAVSQNIDLQSRITAFRRRLLTCYRNLQDNESIIGVYKEALDEEPGAATAPEYLYSLSETYLNNNDTLSAAEHFSYVVERYPFSDYAQRVRQEHSELLASKIDYDWNPYEIFQSALTAGVLGDFDGAIAQFDTIIKTHRSSAMVHAASFQKEMVEFRRTGDATALINTIANTQDEYPYGYGGVAINLLIQILERISDIQEAITSNPDDVGSYAGMAYYFYQLRAYHRGIDAYKKALDIEPENQNLCNMLGYCYLGAEDYQSAIKTFERLVELAPENPNSYDSKAEAYYTSGDTVMAIQLYRKSLDIDSTFSNPYYMLGRIFSEQGQDEKAIHYLEKYIERDPGGYRIQNAQRLLERLR